MTLPARHRQGIRTRQGIRMHRRASLGGESALQIIPPGIPAHSVAGRLMPARNAPVIDVEPVAWRVLMRRRGVL